MNPLFRTFFLLLALLTALAAPAAAQPDPRLRERLDPATFAEVGAVLDSARAGGLPTEPLVRKALEGASKGADGPRIAASVRLLAGRLRSARTALGPRATEAELTSAAAALYVGVAPEALRRVRGRSAGGSLAMAYVALAFLVQEGVPAETSSRIVEQLVGARATDDDFVILQRQVAADVGSGATPATAAQARARGLLIRRSGPGPRPGDDEP